MTEEMKTEITEAVKTAVLEFLSEKLGELAARAINERRKALGKPDLEL